MEDKHNKTASCLAFLYKHRQELNDKQKYSENISTGCFSHIPNLSG